MIKKIILTAMVTLCIVVLVSCNTIHGIGKDLESAGEAIERASDKK